MSQVATPIPEPEARHQGPSRWALVAFVVGVLLLIGGAAVANLVFRATRSSFADAIPSNSVAFFHVDLLNVVLSEDLGRMVDAFDPDFEPGTDGFDAEFELDRLFLEEGYRFDFSNDIVPWVGRGVAVGVVDVEGRSGVPEFVVAVDVRDRSEFQEFWSKLLSTLEEESGEPVLESEFSGVTIYSAIDASMAFTQDTLIVGPDDRSVRSSIDALQGDSLADNPAFAEVVAELPADRMLTGWFRLEGYTEMLEDSIYDPVELDAYRLLFDDAELPSTYAFSADLADPGVRMDFAAIYPEGSELMAVVEDFAPDVAAMAPADTIGYLAVPPFVDVYLDLFTELLAAEMEEERAEFQAQYGLDPVDDLGRLLDGPLGLVVSRNDAGLFATGFDVPIDVAGFLGTSQPERLRDNITLLVEAEGSEQFLGPRGDPQLWDVQQGEQSWPFGVDYGQLMAASDRVLLEEMFVHGGPTLQQDGSYQEAADQLGSAPWFYLDIGKVIELIPPEGVPAEAAIFEYTAVGYRLDGSVMKGAWILSLDL